MRVIYGVLLVASSTCLIWPSSQVIAQHASPDTLSSHVAKLERLAWEMAKKKDRGSLGKLLSEDYTEIIDDGVFDKAHLLTYLKDVTLTHYAFRNVTVKRLTPTAVLLVYQVSEQGEYKGHPFQADNNVASLWMNRIGNWQNVLFQETPIPR